MHDRAKGFSQSRFLAGGGEMGALIRTHDWASTPLGPPETWPATLKSSVRTALTTRHPMLIFWGEDCLCLYNDGVRASLGPEKHPGILGTPARVAWADTWDVTGPQFAQVLGGGEATWHENHLVPMNRHGGLQDVYWTYSYGPIHDEAAPHCVGGVLVICTETTQDVLARRERTLQAGRAQAALRESEERLQLALEASGGIGIYDWHIPEDRVIADSRYAAMFDLDPEALASGVSIDVCMRALHPDDEPRIAAASRHARATGELFDEEYRVGGAEAVRWIAARGRCVRNEAGEPMRFSGTVVDVTKRKLTEERQELLSREVDHRAKNALAVVLAALRLTQARDLQSYRRAIEGRVLALARAQTLLSDNLWSGADLQTMLRAELKGFVGGGDAGEPQAELAGPAVALPPGAAQPLAMAIHELATNAVKYGALSTPTGRLSVTWELGRGPARTLQLRWSEKGGPLVEGAPAQLGFGARVLDVTVHRQLQGAVTLLWMAPGLVCDIEFPLRREPLKVGSVGDDMLAEG